MICKHCGEEIAIDENVGWIHRESQSHFGQRCDKCGRTVLMRGTPTVCPHCQEKAVFHLDHRAEPKQPAPRAKWAPATAVHSHSSTPAKREETTQAELLLRSIERELVEPDAAALQHLSPRRVRRRDWVD